MCPWKTRTHGSSRQRGQAFPVEEDPKVAARHRAIQSGKKPSLKLFRYGVTLEKDVNVAYVVLLNPYEAELLYHRILSASEVGGEPVTEDAIQVDKETVSVSARSYDKAHRIAEALQTLAVSVDREFRTSRIQVWREGLMVGVVPRPQAEDMVRSGVYQWMNEQTIVESGKPE